MAGTVQGGKAAAITNKTKYGEDFYIRIGAIGGKNGKTCGILGVMNILKDIAINPDYKISDKGVVFSKNCRPMTPQFDNKGYLRVQIRTPHKHNGVTTLKVHRVVAEHFIPNPDNLPQVDHIDGDKSNNTVDNLEWVTNEENMQRAVARNAFDKKPDNLEYVGGQILTAIENGYVARDLFELNSIGRKTFWKYVENGDVLPSEIIDITLGRKKKYYYYDKSRNKWRVERSDGRDGKQFDTEQEAIEYSGTIVGGGFASPLLCDCEYKEDLHKKAECAGYKGGTISRKNKGY